MKNLKVQAIDRHRFATDGKGITTLVALAGCPLQCKYCINKKLLQKAAVKEYTKESLQQVLLQDYCYFVATGGGITFGGGEPLLQAEALAAFIDILPKGVAVNLETSLCVPPENLDILLTKITYFIIDIKTVDPDIYLSYTGRTNELVIHNLNKIVESGLQNKCKIRIPNIPDYTDEQAVQDARTWVKNMGFEEIEVFDYKIK